MHRREGTEAGILPGAGLQAFRDSIRLLISPRFGTFWFASLLSSIGTWAQQVAEPWLLLALGASSFLVGLDSFAATAPAWVLTLIGGALADHADRRRVIARFQSIQMLCPITVVVLLVTGHVHPWIIIALSFIVGVTDALSMPSFSSIVPSIVTHEAIPAGLALNATQFNLSRIIGPVVAGVLMARVGMTACFGVSALSYLPFIGVAVWILPRAVDVRPSAGRSRLNPWADVGRILWQPGPRGALVTVLTTSTLCSPLLTFSPVLVRDAFHGGANSFSAAVAAFGVGGLVGAVGLLALSPAVDRRRVSIGGAVTYAGVVVATAINPRFGGLLPLLALAGAALAVSNTSANTLIQSSAPPHLLGQTVSLYALTINVGVSVGALLMGGLASLFGIRTALLASGAAALAIQSVAGRHWSVAMRAAATA